MATDNDNDVLTWTLDNANGDTSTSMITFDGIVSQSKPDFNFRHKVVRSCQQSELISIVWFAGAKNGTFILMPKLKSDAIFVFANL